MSLDRHWIDQIDSKIQNGVVHEKTSSHVSHFTALLKLSEQCLLCSLPSCCHTVSSLTITMFLVLRIPAQPKQGNHEPPYLPFLW